MQGVGVSVLGVECICGDDPASQIPQLAQEWRKVGDLVRFLSDGSLPDGASGVVGEGSHQKHAGAVSVFRAADFFPVDRDGFVCDL